MSFALYRLLSHLLLPLSLIYLLKKSITHKKQLQNITERYAINLPPAKLKPIWVHAVSLGETHAAIPLLLKLHFHFPNCSFLLTHMTLTGRHAKLPDDLEKITTRLYLPYDVPFLARKFFKHYQPVFGIIIETEIWPNLIHAAKNKKIPLFLLNARLSLKSYKHYALFPKITRQILDSFCAIATASQQDAVHFKRLSNEVNISIMGNLKFDRLPNQEKIDLGKIFRSQFPQKNIFLCSSTRTGEEELILKEWKKRELQKKDILLILVPRHPERFKEVSELAQSHGFNVQNRSSGFPINEAASLNIWVGNSMGEMEAYYQCCDVAFVGGSLLDFGGQNIIEACQLGKPVIVGPSSFNFQEIIDNAKSLKAIASANNVGEIIDSLECILINPDKAKKLAENSLKLAQKYSGASDKAITLLKRHLSKLDQNPD